MNRVNIRHRTRYSYTDNIFLEPHSIRLSPRPDPHVHLSSQSVTIVPTPAGISSIIDTDGTVAQSVWFDCMTAMLDIEIRTDLTVAPFNPFDFLIHPPECIGVPMVYPDHLTGILSPYRACRETVPEVARFAEECAQEKGCATIATLLAIGDRINTRFTYEKRESGTPNSAGETVRTGKGACRDFAVLAMALYRHLGVACRFVSGYCLGENDNEAGELHSWVEVYLPGGGWKGFDPTNAVICTGDYLALSASADPLRTAPVAGTFRGNASSRMTSELSIKRSHITDNPDVSAVP